LLSEYTAKNGNGNGNGNVVLFSSSKTEITFLHQGIDQELVLIQDQTILLYRLVLKSNLDSPK